MNWITFMADREVPTEYCGFSDGYQRLDMGMSLVIQQLKIVITEIKN